jgi:hypothetical protein
MWVEQQWEYVILPIGVILGCVYKIFEDNDRQYLMSQGIDPDDCNEWFPDLFLDGNDKPYRHTQSKHYQYYNNNTSYNSSHNTYVFNDNKNIYKEIVKKCKRNVKIKIEDKS